MSGDTAERLESALRVASAFEGREDSRDNLHAWMQGLNPELGDKSPARVLRHRELPTVVVVTAASNHP